MGVTRIFESGYVTIPEDAEGILERIEVVGGAGQDVDVWVTYDGIYTVGENNRGLMDRLEALEKRVGCKKVHPMLTLVDDDGNARFYTSLYPLALSKSAPIASAIPFSFVDDGNANHLSKSQIMEMYLSGVVEVISHTYSHNLPDGSVTELQYEVDYRKAKNGFASMGIPTDLLIYSGSSGNSNEARRAASRVYDGAIMSGNETINHVGDDCYQLRRYGVMGGDEPNRLNGNDINSLKNAIDALVADGGWMIWMLHTSMNYWNDGMCANIGTIIDYARSKGIEIVTAKHGFDSYYGTKTQYNG